MPSCAPADVRIVAELMSDDPGGPPRGDGVRCVADLGENRVGVLADLGDGVHAGLGAVEGRRGQGRPQGAGARRHLPPTVAGPELRMLGRAARRS